MISSFDEPLELVFVLVLGWTSFLPLITAAMVREENLIIFETKSYRVFFLQK